MVALRLAERGAVGPFKPSRAREFARLGLLDAFRGGRAGIPQPVRRAPALWGTPHRLPGLTPVRLSVRGETVRAALRTAVGLHESSDTVNPPAEDRCRKPYGRRRVATTPEGRTPILVARLPLYLPSCSFLYA